MRDPVPSAGPFSRGHGGDVGAARADLTTVAVVLIVAGMAWLPTLSPGVRMEHDVGELQAVCATGGVAHPTGFPLWTLACFGFSTAFPLGEAAWRANLFTMLCGLGALVPLFFILRQLGVARMGSAAGALGFAALPANWRAAVAAEVYQLHLVLMGMAWLGVVGWIRGRGEGWLRGAVVAACLGVGVHPQMALSAPGLLVAVILADRRAALRLVPTGVVALGLGLLPNVWLWMRVHDPTTPFRNIHGVEFSVFLSHITGAQFHGQMLSVNPDGALWREVGLQTLLAAGAAVLLGRVRPLPLRAGLVVSGILHATFALTYGIGELAPYVLPIAWLGVVAAVCAVAAVARLERVAMGVALFMLVLNRGAGRHEQAATDAARARAIAERSPDGVVVVCGWAELGGLWAQQLATEQGGPFPVAGCPGAGSVPLESVWRRLSVPDRMPHQPGTWHVGEAVWFVGSEWSRVGAPLEEVGPDLFRVPVEQVPWAVRKASTGSP